MPELHVYTLANHLDGRAPSVRATYDCIIALLESFGPLTIEPKKTTIHLVHRTALGGIVTRKENLLLEFKSDVPIDSPRITVSDHVSRSRYHHTVRLSSPDEVDAEIATWLRAAYDLSA